MKERFKSVVEIFGLIIACLLFLPLYILGFLLCVPLLLLSIITSPIALIYWILTGKDYYYYPKQYFKLYDIWI